MSFSSYPGVVFSIDDYYILSSGLVVTETSIQNSNAELYKFVDQPEKIVLEFVRTLTANRLSRTGREWTEIFSEYNSGTYNNQFMVVDYNRFGRWLHHKSFAVNQADILWVVEQMPGTIERKDLTSVLLEQKYFASYNRPYFELIFNLSGANTFVDKFGDYYSYARTPRALIFARDQDKVRDIATMYQIMRYNDFQHDPLSRCNCSPPYTAIAAIAARNDLNEPNGQYAVPTFGFRGSGAIDAKLTSVELASRLEFIAVSGPTHEQQTPFIWSQTHTTISAKLRHRGQPDAFTFRPQHVKWYPEVGVDAF
jgi:hypothetical protein